MKSSRILSFSFFYIFFLLQEHLALGANVTTTTTAKYQIECTMCPSCDNPCQPDPSPPPPPASSSPNCPPPPSPPSSPPRRSKSRTSVSLRTLHYSTLGVALVSFLSSCFAAYVVITRTKNNNNNNGPAPVSPPDRRKCRDNIVPAGLEIDLEAKIWGNIVAAGFVPAGLEIDLEAKIWGNNVPAGLEIDLAKKIWDNICASRFGDRSGGEVCDNSRDGKYLIMDG